MAQAVSCPRSLRLPPCSPPACQSLPSSVPRELCISCVRCGAAGGDDPKWAHRMEDMKSGFITEPYPEAVLAEMARRIGANPAFEGSFFINALGLPLLAFG